MKIGAIMSTTDLFGKYTDYIGKRYIVYPFLKWGDATSSVWTVTHVTCTCQIYADRSVLSGEMIHISTGDYTSWYPSRFLNELRTPDRNDVIEEMQWRMKSATPSQRVFWEETIKALSSPEVTVAECGWIKPDDWKAKQKIYQPWK